MNVVVYLSSGSRREFYNVNEILEHDDGDISITYVDVGEMVQKWERIKSVSYDHIAVRSSI
ncbi:MAG: hypothetical protein J6S67_13130 [Methanobrevibacter sp.]|nr:hypothetical protein [Methanobrevibacter sp.]